MIRDEGEDFTLPRMPQSRQGAAEPEIPSDDDDADPGDDGGPALPVGSRLREFEVRGVVGEGGFSIVYEAWDHSLQRKVALKEYIPSALARRGSDFQITVRSQRDRDTYELGLRSFVNEARLLATFDHPALVKVHQFWSERGTAYIVMPLYQGVTLKKLLAAGTTRVDERWLKELLRPLFDALAVMHAQRCYHRDIAPDNILMLDDGLRPLLLDFGAARQVAGDRTQDLTVILKNGYAPIEQYGEIPGMRQGPWTDVYAIAAVAHYALRGKVPPPSVGRLARDTYEPLAQARAGDCSPRFLSALDRALSVNPEQRPQTIEEFRAALGLDDETASPRRWPSKRRLMAALMAVGALGAAAELAVPGRFRIQAQPRDLRSAAAMPAPVTLPSGATSALAPAPPGRAAEAAAAARAQADLERLVRLSRAEKRDPGAAVAEVEALQANAARARQSGDPALASAFDTQADALARSAFDKLAAELVSGYSKVSREAVAIGNFKVAQQALDRAKAIQALQRN